MKETSRGSGVVRRARALVPLGIAAAVVIGGVALSASANADSDVQGENNLTVTLSIGTNTVNDGTSGWNPTNSGTVHVINSSGQPQNAAPGDVFSVYTAVTGAGLTQDMVNPFPGFGNIVNGLANGTNPLFFLPPSSFGANCPANSFCNRTDLPTADGFDQNLANGNADATHISANMNSDTLPFDVTIDSRTGGTHAFTGPVTFTTEVVELDAAGHVVRILGGAAATTNLANPAAPVVHAAPAATVDQAYSFQVVDLGFPGTPEAFPGAGGPAPGGDNYSCTYVENNHTHTTTCTAGWRIWAKNPDGSLTLLRPFLDPATGDWTYYLPYNFDGVLPISPPTPQNGSFFLDTATGKLVANEYQQAQANGAPTTYIIEVNNGIGGASHDDVLNGNLAAGVNPVHLHDVVGSIGVATLFSDVPTTNPFYKAIQLLANDGIIEGYADGTFRPGVNVTRQAFAHFLAEYLDFAIQTSPSPQSPSQLVGTGACNDVHTGQINASAFKDVANTSQFCAEITGLSEAGVVHGYTDGTYRPGENISRQAMSAMLWRAHEYYLGHSLNGGDGDLPCTTSAFNDVATTNPFCGDIAWMAQHSISQGYTDGGYHPADPTSRQATAQFIYNLGTFDIANFQYLKPVVP